MADLHRPYRPTLFSRPTKTPAAADYGDVFGGPPKFSGVPPQPDEYGEIFGGFAARKGGGVGIPFLDLPALGEGEASVGAGLDYGEVFGCSGSGRFAIDFREVFSEQESEERPAVLTGQPYIPTVLSDDCNGNSSASDRDQYSPNELSPHTQDGTQQYNVSYNKSNYGVQGDLPNGTTHVTELHEVPGFAVVVESSFNSKMAHSAANLNGEHMELSNRILEKDICRETSSQVPYLNNAQKNSRISFIGEEDVQLVSKFSGERKEHVKEVYSISSEKNANLMKFNFGTPASDHSLASNEHLSSDGDKSLFQKVFLTVSDINLRTQPSRIPPPSRPPPNLQSKDVKESIGKVCSDSPSFLDLEVDAKSDAAASAAAMRKAMEKAQAKLKSVRESMEKRRPNSRNRLQSGLNEDHRRTAKLLDDDGKPLKVDDAHEAAEHRHQTSGFYGSGPMRGANRAFEPKGHTEKVLEALVEGCRKESLADPPSSNIVNQTVELKAEKQFYELVNNGSKQEFVNVYKESNNDHKFKEKLQDPDQKQSHKPEVPIQIESLRAYREGYNELKAYPELGQVMGDPKAGFEDQRSMNNQEHILGKDEHGRVRAMLNSRSEKSIEEFKENISESKWWATNDVNGHDKVKADEDNNMKEALEHEEKKRLKEVQERVEKDKRKKEAIELEEEEKRLKTACDHDEDEKRLKTACEHEEEEKRQSEREEEEKRLKADHEREEEERRLRADHEREEEEKKARAALEREEEEKRLRAAREREEQEKRLRVAREREEEEKRLRAALEREEEEKRMRAAREREEEEKKVRAALEREEDEKKMRAAREREEQEKRLRAAHECEEQEKKLRAAHEREEEEKRMRAAREREEEEKRLTAACKSEEEERRLTAACERKEEERRLTATREREEEKRQRVACEHEEEKRLKEDLQREEEVKRVRAAALEGERKMLMAVHEREEEEKRLKAAHEHEEENQLKVAREHEKEEKRSKAACDSEKEEKRLKAEHEEKSLKVNCELEDQDERLKAARDREEVEEQLQAVLECKGEDKRPKSLCVCEEEQRLQAFCLHEEKKKKLQEAYEHAGKEKGLQADDEHNEEQGTVQMVCEHEKDEKKLKVANEHEEEERPLQASCKLVDEKMELEADYESEDKKKLKVKVSCKLDDEMRQKAACKYEEENRLNVAREQRKDERIKVDEECSEENGRLEFRGHPLPFLFKKKGNNAEDDVQVNIDLKSDRSESKEAEVTRGNVQFEKNGPMVSGQEVPTNGSSTASDVFSMTVNEGKSGPSRMDKEVMDHREKEIQKQRERNMEVERLRILEEERERQIEREKDRIAVENVIRESRDRAFAEARERAERAAAERAATESRQRALAEARERAERTTSGAVEAARLRAERAAVERATAEARQRAIEKVMATVKDKPDYSSGQNSLHSDERSFYATAGETAQRCKARLERHQRTAERAAKALAEKNRRDILSQREQAERNRLAETLDADIRRWSNGKEGNLRALLSTLQYILGPESGWQPVPLTEVLTAAAVKKAYRKATLCVHPDKVQQRGASIQQKYVCEKVFDLLKDAWNKFNSEER